jgi:hypothetical protein
MMKIRKIAYHSITFLFLFIFLLACAAYPRYSIKIYANGSGSDILVGYFKSEASNQGFIIFEELNAISVVPAYQLNSNTNLGSYQALDNCNLHCWYVQASIDFTDISTGKKIYMTLNDIQDINARIYGGTIKQALRGSGPNSFSQKIGEPFMKEFFRRIDRFLLVDQEDGG